MTADVRYRRFDRDVAEPVRSPADAAQFVAGLSADMTASQVAVRLGHLCPSPGGAGVDSRLVMEGQRTRYEYGNALSIRDAESDLIFDGDNRQFDVYGRGRSRRMFADVGQLRFTPFAAVQRSAFREVAVTADSVELSSTNGGNRLVVDRATGVLLHSQSIEPSTGVILRESWEREIAAWNDGVPFPMLRVDADYSDGRLRRIAVRQVLAADFNIDIAPAEFEMPGLRGQVVVDRRSEEKRVYPLRDNVAHLASVLPSPAASRGEIAPTRGTHERESFRWWLAVNGCLLIAGGAYLWRRERRTQVAEQHTEVVAQSRMLP